MFKIGDKVKVVTINETTTYDLLIGKTAVVTEVTVNPFDGEAVYMIKFDEPADARNTPTVGMLDSMYVVSNEITYTEHQHIWTPVGGESGRRDDPISHWACQCGKTLPRLGG